MRKSIRGLLEKAYFMDEVDNNKVDNDMVISPGESEDEIQKE